MGLTSHRVVTGAAGSTESYFVDEHGTANQVLEGSYLGARLVALPEETGTTLLLVSRFHELSTFVHGRVTDLGAFSDLLDQIQIADEVAGLRLAPRPGSTCTVEVFGALNSIPDTCGVTVRESAQDPDIVPRHRGAGVNGGEVWAHEERSEAGDLVGRVFVLANDTSTATLVEAGASGTRMERVLESIRFEFDRPPDSRPQSPAGLWR